MQTITKIIAALVIIGVINLGYSQETEQSKENRLKIELLEKQKEKVQEEERELLKAEVEAINKRLDKGEINLARAEELKGLAAEKRAANIANRIAIIDNKIDLLKRNPSEELSDDEDPSITIRIGSGDDDDEVIYIGSDSKKKYRKYDRRTSSDLVLAFGLNNALIDGQDLDDSPYKIGGSRFFEIGWAWRTRVFDNSNWLRLKYGFSFQINGLKAKDDLYFVEDGDITSLEEFPVNLRKAKLSVSNLVLPVHFEFGPSKKIERENYFRYSTRNQFKMGIGGYAGFNIGTRQKLKYSEDGDKVKEKIKKDYNTSSFVYGLSGYVAIQDVALYLKYDLSPIFKDQAIDQNNISLGLRFDID